MTNSDNRVLCRKNACELSQEEYDNVGGGFRVTTTFCTAFPHRVAMTIVNRELTVTHKDCPGGEGDIQNL